jgi:hypothetical protein
MTFAISTENIYLIVIIVLMALQVYQFKLISDLKKDASQIWDQMAILSMIASKILGDVVNKKKQEQNGEDSKV